jgi:hypothetical protein
MKLYTTTVAILLLAAGSGLPAKQSTPQISGGYLEVRSCDVYTGPCFANGEMGLTGKEAVMVWSIRQGSWKGVTLDGLNVIAVVKTDDTMGDLRYQPRSGPAVLITDAAADARQKEALAGFAQSMAGKLIDKVVNVQSAKMEVAIGACAKAGCATVKAGKLVEITTRCLGDKDHLCGNEDTFYPPLTEVTDAYPVFTESAAFTGTGLNLTWELIGKRSAFLAAFSR